MVPSEGVKDRVDLTAGKSSRIVREYQVEESRATVGRATDEDHRPRSGC